MLHCLRQQPDVEVAGLLTTLDEQTECITMHAVRRTLLMAQAAALELPLHVVLLPHPCRNEEYRRALNRAFERARRDGIDAVAYGDLFLADVRAWRESFMQECGLAALFPLWHRDTAVLARDMLQAGLQARLTCVDMRQMPAAFGGREYDYALLSELPATVDPCGENGEFHTFVHDGPMFSRRIEVAIGETVESGGFVYTDLYPAPGHGAKTRKKR